MPERKRCLKSSPPAGESQDKIPPVMDLGMLWVGGGLAATPGEPRDKRGTAAPAPGVEMEEKRRLGGVKEGKKAGMGLKQITIKSQGWIAPLLIDCDKAEG